jgi:hypothetical protein
MEDHAANITCYMCEKPGDTKEHVPPRSFFPKEEGFRKNLITVPSCSEHNNEKSGEDEYMRVLFAGTAGNTLNSELENRTIRSLQHKKKLAHEIIAMSRTRRGYTVNEQRIKTYLASVAKAIYRHAFGEKFQGDLNIAPHFLDNFRTARDLRMWSEKAKREFAWRRILATRPMLPEYPWEGENPDIFRYRIWRSDTSAMLEMEFYETHRIDCLFTRASAA